MRNILKFTFIIVALFVGMTLVPASAQVAPPDQARPHDDITFPGLRLRTDVAIPSYYGPLMHAPALLQEIIPCRLVSTLEKDRLPQPWGGPAFQPMESRSYAAKGHLEHDDILNPCSDRIPYEAIALTVRVTVLNPDDPGHVYLTRGDWSPFTQPRLLSFEKGQTRMEESGVMIPSATLWIGSTAKADFTVDVLGFFVPDPNGVPLPGPEGPIGPGGPAGSQGIQGDPGPAGERGENGP